MDELVFMEMSIDFKTARIDAGRKAILDAAEACARKGKPLQMGDLADEAGIAVGTIYRYFDGKQGLEDALIGRMLVSFTMRVEETHDPDADPATRLDALLRAICRAALDHLGALHLFLERSTWSQLGTSYGAVGEARKTYARYAKLEQEILALLKLNRVRTETALVFLRASLMAGLTRLGGARPAEQRRGIDEIVRLITRGLLGGAG